MIIDCLWKRVEGANVCAAAKQRNRTASFGAGSFLYRYQ
jgi:hypothetical protein